ncbi:MAG: hypothetical protein IJE49_02990 [Agathobacter sp.]|nr:hypothetical protein [Agathobacter sp.]
MTQKEIGFFDKFYIEHIGTGSKFLYRVLAGVWCILAVIGCTIPAQEIMLGSQRGDFVLDLLPTAISIGSCFAISTCIAPFRTYTEQNIKNNVGSVIVLLQYHPVDKINLQKQKIKYQFQFLVKLTLLCLLVQLVATYISLGEIEWLNIAYIFILVFLIPGILEIVCLSWIKLRVLYGR